VNIVPKISSKMYVDFKYFKWLDFFEATTNMAPEITLIFFETLCYCFTVAIVLQVAELDRSMDHIPNKVERT